MKKNNSDKHRKSIRLKEYDYSQPGVYFVTICTWNREMYFVKYPELKAIVLEQWQKLPTWFPNIESDEFIIMPNHIHGIIFIIHPGSDVVVDVGAGLAPARMNRATASVAPTLGKIIGTYKSICVKEWMKCIHHNNITAVGKIWQRNYYEHIIRYEEELNKIKEYIVNNPLKWELDIENPDRKKDYANFTDYLKEQLR